MACNYKLKDLQIEKHSMALQTNNVGFTTKV